jgi:hypothetical protein
LYVCISLLPGTCYIPCPSPCFEQHDIWQAVNMVTLIIMLEGSWFFFIMTAVEVQTVGECSKPFTMILTETAERMLWQVGTMANKTSYSLPTTVPLRGPKALPAKAGYYYKKKWLDCNRIWISRNNQQDATSLDNSLSPHGYINQRLRIQFGAHDERYVARNMLSIQWILE